MTQARQQLLEALQDSKRVWDLIVIGGGITGAGILHEAASRGLSVLLIEQKDFAWGTSSRSSKMVHGGLRYLGSGQFGLAHDSVTERQQLLAALPGLVDPLPFMMGHYRGVFPGPRLFNLLLTIYDWMAGKRYRRFYAKGANDFWVPGIQQQDLQGLTQFADAVTDDARLVLRVLQEAQTKGAVALNYMKAVEILKQSDQVDGVIAEDLETGARYPLHAKAVINATGVWTDELRGLLGQKKVIRPLRGSHLVVPFWRLPVSFSVSFFHPDDKRPVFVFPWEGVTVIGTTDMDHKENASREATISQTEVAYLLDAANRQFPKASLKETDVRATWAGVRPVVSKSALRSGATLDLSQSAKPSDEKREHAIWDDAGLISVAGGKLTTFRLIALDVLKKAAPYLGRAENDFKHVSSFHTANRDRDFSGQGLSKTSIKRLQGRYGNKLQSLIDMMAQQPKLAKPIASTDTLCVELVWACEQETVIHLDDLLLRRTRLGLLLEQGGDAWLPQIKELCQSLLVWSEEQWQAETERYREIIRQHYSLPKPYLSKASLSSQGFPRESEHV